MNKKIIIRVSILMLVIVTISGYIYLNNKNFVDIAINKKQIKSTNMLTMMLETEAGTGVYEETTASEWPIDGYVFNETLSKCENGSELSWDNNLKKIIFASTKADKCYIYFDIYVEPTLAEICNGKSLAECIKENVYTKDGETGLYYHDGIGTYANASEEAGDNSYRYSGANPNNYVCFGSDAATCPEDNLYRIIGLFDDDQDEIYNIKLIKKTSIGYNVWSDNDSTYWDENTKPIIYTKLNTNYWNTMSSEWQKLIVQNQKWQVGGIPANTTYTAKQIYNVEVGAEQTGYEEVMFIGLMYVSDYGYAASPENWQTALYDYDNTANTKNNWLYSNSADLSISKQLNVGNYAYRINDNGQVSSVQTRYGSSPTRPAFYLNSMVLLKSGTGTDSDPYRLSL